MTVIVRLREMREEVGLSQNALAREMGMSLGNIQKIEYNKAMSIPFETLDDLCRILECEVGDLLVRIDDDD
jgi:putative transcriptional regulator